MNVDLFYLLNSICKNSNLITAEKILDDLNVDYYQIAEEFKLDNLNALNDTAQKLYATIFLIYGDFDLIIDLISKIDINDEFWSECFNNEKVKKSLNAEAWSCCDVDLIEQILKSDLVYYEGISLEKDTVSNLEPRVVDSPDVFFDHILDKRTTRELVISYVKEKNWIAITGKDIFTVYRRDIFGVVEELFKIMKANKEFIKDISNKWLPEMDKYFDEHGNFISDDSNTQFEFVESYIIDNLKE